MWKLLGTITSNLRRDSELFGSMKSSLFISNRFQSTVRVNETVEKWFETLAEDKQKRIRHIQNEVSMQFFFKKFFLFCPFFD